MPHVTPRSSARRLALAVVLALLVTLGLAAPAAQAATGIAVGSSGGGLTTTDTGRTLTATLTNNGTAVTSSSVVLQRRSGTTWVTEATVAIKNGKGSILVKHGPGNVTYRFLYTRTSKASPNVVVRFNPATFTVNGSGSGHGVGMSQYGAYQLSRSGKTAAQILQTYYAGAGVSTAVNNTTSQVAVQVLGAPTDTRTSTTVTVTGGGFQLQDKTGKALATYGGPGAVTFGVSGTNVTAKVSLADGTVTNRVLAAGPQFDVLLRKTATTTPVATVAGAPGSYAYGRLVVTNLRSRPNVVNRVLLNTEYLYGVDEMPSAWGTTGGAAALQAQAVVARTYIIRKVSTDKTKWVAGVDPACNCNVFDDTRHQNYTGWKKAGGAANAPWVAAVKATATTSTVTVLRASASSTAVLAETPYFASTGWYTAGTTTYRGTGSNLDVYGTAQLPYLRSVTDTASAAAPGNPYAKWSTALTSAKVRSVFGMSDVQRVDVAARYPGGLVKTLRATSSTGTTKSITRTAEAWRTTLGVRAPWIASVTGK